MHKCMKLTAPHVMFKCLIFIMNSRCTSSLIMSKKLKVLASYGQMKREIFVDLLPHIVDIHWVLHWFNV